MKLVNVILIVIKINVLLKYVTINLIPLVIVHHIFINVTMILLNVKLLYVNIIIIQPMKNVKILCLIVPVMEHNVFPEENASNHLMNLVVSHNQMVNYVNGLAHNVKLDHAMLLQKP